eukprot:COSAG02_NODE_81_length_39811_cov_51.728898_17_plen_77_part_00
MVLMHALRHRVIKTKVTSTIRSVVIRRLISTPEVGGSKTLIAHVHESGVSTAHFVNFSRNKLLYLVRSLDLTQLLI